MKYWKAAIFFLIAYLLQCSLLNVIAIGGYTPNLLLALVVVFAFLYGEEPYAAVFGTAFGLIYDICYEEIVGPTAIALLIVAILISFMRYGVNIENPINLAIDALISIAAYYFCYWGLLALSGTHIYLFRMVWTALFAGVYSFIIVVILYAVLVRTVIKHRKDRHFR